MWRTPEQLRRWLVLPPVLFATWVGRGYLLDDPRRFQSATFGTPKQIGSWFLGPTDIYPMRVWGVVFLIGAAVMAIAAISQSGQWLGYALLIGGGLYAFWAAVFAYGALTDPRASTNGPASYLFIAAVHFIGAYRVRDR